jgi:hypothetical protein
MQGWRGGDGVCHHFLLEHDGYSVEVKPDFTLAMPLAIKGPSSPC